MPEWLHTSLANGSDPSLTVLAWRIGMAMVLGATVAAIYRWAQRGEAVQPTFLDDPGPARHRDRHGDPGHRRQRGSAHSAWWVRFRSCGSGRSSRTRKTQRL